MKKTIFTITIFFMIAYISYAQELDGNWWSSLTPEMRAGLVTGFMMGSNKVVSAHKTYIAVNNILEHKKIVTVEQVESLKEYGLYNIQVLPMMEGVDALYKDFKNRNIKIEDAIYVVKRQITGTSPSDIDRILLFLRNGKQDFTPLILERDKDGKPIKAIIFP